MIDTAIREPTIIQKISQRKPTSPSESAEVFDSVDTGSSLVAEMMVVVVEIVVVVARVVVVVVGGGASFVHSGVAMASFTTFKYSNPRTLLLFIFVRISI